MIVVRDEIESIIQSIKSTGTIVSFVDNGNGTCTITTNDIGNLEIGFKVVLKYTDSLNDKDVYISTISGNSFTFSGTGITHPNSWEMALYFESGHRIEINKLYQNKAKSLNKQVQEYPLVWMYTDYERRPSEYEESEFVTTLQFALVDFTDKNLYEEQRIEDKFKPILYPILELIDNAFNDSINKRKFVTLFRNPEIDLIATDRPFFGSMDKSQNVMPDPTDAIEFQVELNWRRTGSVCTGY